MLVEIKNFVEELPFGEFSGGDLFVYNNETFIALVDEIPSPRSRYNAVNLETGELAYFPADEKVICPNDYTLTVEL